VRYRDAAFTNRQSRQSEIRYELTRPNKLETLRGDSYERSIRPSKALFGFDHTRHLFIQLYGFRNLKQPFFSVDCATQMVAVRP